MQWWSCPRVRGGFLFLLAAGLVAAAAEAPPVPPLLPLTVAGNLMKNPGFEVNWSNRKFGERRRFLLLQGSDMGLAEEDGHLDHWRVQGAKPPACWDLAVAHSGARSVRLEQAAKLTQLLRGAGEQYWQAGGSSYARFLPLSANLAAQAPRRPIVVGAWCRAADVPPKAAPELRVTVECAVRKDYESTATVGSRKFSASIAFTAGTHDWEYREVRLLPKPEKPATLPGAGPAVGPESAPATGAGEALDPAAPQYEDTPWWITVELAAKGGGTVWFDDLSCVEPVALTERPNLLPNGDFEDLAADGFPAGWAPPALWGWFRNDYYGWTGWSHFEQKTWRGGAAADPLVTWQGRRALRCVVYPGDNFAIAGPVIALRPDVPRLLEARAVVKADHLRTLEIMAQDEAGRWLPQGDFIGDDQEEPGAYNFGTTGNGTYGWTTVRKFFSPRQALTSVRLFLCVRGFDGALVADKNLVGTVWFDDVQLLEYGPPRLNGLHKGGRGAAPPPWRVVELDLGDRLWGRNTLRAWAEFSTVNADAVGLAVTLTAPDGTKTESAGTMRVLRPPADGMPGLALVEAPYQVTRLCANAQEQYRLTLAWTLPAGVSAVPPAEFAFGTPATLLTAGASGSFFYPDETAVAYVNLHVAAAEFPRLRELRTVITTPQGARPGPVVRDFAALLAPQAGPEMVNTRRLLQVPLTSAGAVVHPWSEPVPDHAVVFQLYTAGPDDAPPVATTAPVRFGFMQPVPKATFPAVIRRTAINARGFITINDEPYFPVYWTPHMGIRPEVNYPPSQFGCKSVDLTKILYAKGAAPDDEVKAALLAKVAEVKDDPKLFGYELGEGEMQLQGGWQERLAWCRQASAWVRAADPNHVINGPISWLVGHPRHNEVMKEFVGAWDIIGVEASFMTVPEFATHAKPFMKERPAAMMVGLETYFYQANEALRWRAYRSIYNGATGVGLCPSGMMQSRPDKENYLRGLNGEFRGLAPILVAPEPAARVTCDAPEAVLTFERELDGKRYVSALRELKKIEWRAGGVRFTFPAGTTYRAVRVRGEARTLAPDATGFADRFADQFAVHVYELTP